MSTGHKRQYSRASSEHAVPLPSSVGESLKGRGHPRLMASLLGECDDAGPW
jgi:hypothetical protein